MAIFAKNWWPNLGGWLAMLNCAGWMLLFMSPRVNGEPPEIVVVILMVVLSLPFGWFLMIPGHTCGPTVQDIVTAGIGLGLNSFAWGYGLAAIRNWIVRGTHYLRSSESGRQSADRNTHDSCGSGTIV